MRIARILIFALCILLPGFVSIAQEFTFDFKESSPNRYLRLSFSMDTGKVTIKESSNLNASASNMQTIRTYELDSIFYFPSEVLDLYSVELRNRNNQTFVEIQCNGDNSRITLIYDGHTGAKKSITSRGIYVDQPVDEFYNVENYLFSSKEGRNLDKYKPQTQTQTTTQTKTNKQPKTNTQTKTTTAQTNTATVVNFQSLKIQKGLVVNGFPSIQVDVAGRVLNGQGQNCHLELYFYDMNGKSIVTDGDRTGADGTRYFVSTNFTTSGSSVPFTWYWKVYKKRLAIPTGAKQIKVEVYVVTDKDRVLGGGTTYQRIINLNTNATDTYNF